MQTIRSRFLTIICGVSLTLSMVFGALAVILVAHDETIIAARTLTIEHEVKDPQELRDKAYRDRLEDKVRRSFYNAISGIDGVQGYYLHYN